MVGSPSNGTGSALIGSVLKLASECVAVSGASVAGSSLRRVLGAATGT